MMIRGVRGGFCQLSPCFETYVGVEEDEEDIDVSIWVLQAT